MKSIRLSRLSIASIAVVAVLPFAAQADWNYNDGESSTAGAPQDIVVSFKQDPMSNPEEACLSVTIARSLRGDFPLPPGAPEPPAFPNVSLFPTLDGVVLGDLHVVRRGCFRCTTPEGVISLRENLEDFLCDTGDREDCCEIKGKGCDLEDNDLNMDNMVVCPICWKERYGDEMPDYGVLNSMAVGAVLLNAEKIIDF